MNEKWLTRGQLNPFGRSRAEKESELDKQYGEDNWREAWLWGHSGSIVLPFSQATEIYGDAYLFYLFKRPKVVDWLKQYRDVYDTDPSNAKSGLNYEAQEDPSVRHLQDIAIRRAMLRLGKSFEGDELLEVRHPGKKGYFLMPGIVPFHIPQYIRHSKSKLWWKPGSVEDFYQSNRVLQIRP